MLGIGQLTDAIQIGEHDYRGWVQEGTKAERLRLCAGELSELQQEFGLTDNQTYRIAQVIGIAFVKKSE